MVIEKLAPLHAESLLLLWTHKTYAHELRGPIGAASAPQLGSATAVTSYITGSNREHRVAIRRFLSRISGVRNMA